MPAHWLDDAPHVVVLQRGHFAAYLADHDLVAHSTEVLLIVRVDFIRRGLVALVLLNVVVAVHFDYH